MHDVYFGTSPVLGPNDFVGRQPFNMYFHLKPLEPGVTYYWRVDEIDAAGNKYEGNVVVLHGDAADGSRPQPV